MSQLPVYSRCYDVWRLVGISVIRSDSARCPDKPPGAHGIRNRELMGVIKLEEQGMIRQQHQVLERRGERMQKPAGERDFIAGLHDERP